MELLLISQRLNALTVKSWVTLLGSVDLLNTRKTEQMVVRKRGLWLLKIQTQKPWWQQTTMKILTGPWIFDAEPVDICDRWHWTEFEEDVWSMGLMPEPMHFGQMAWLRTKILGFGVEYSSSEENNNSSGDETLVDPLYENFKREKAYKAVPLPTVLPQTVKESAMVKSNQTWRPKESYLDSVNRDNGSYTLKQFEYGNPEEDLKDYAIIDSGCSGSMTGDTDKLSDFKEFKGGYVAFGNDSEGGRISGKGTIKTSAILDSKEYYSLWWKITLVWLQRQQKMKLSYGTEDWDMSTSKISASWLKAICFMDLLGCALTILNTLVPFGESKGKGPDWMFDLELLTPSMNYIPVRKENYADSEGNVSTHDDVDDLDVQQFIVHGPSIHDRLQPIAFRRNVLLLLTRRLHLKRKERIALEMGKRVCVDSTFTLVLLTNQASKYWQYTTDSDDDIPKDGVFSTNSFDAENTDTEEGGAADYNNMDPTIDVTSTPTLRIHKIHPQNQIIGKSIAGVQTRRKLKDSTSNQHQALLSFIYKQNRTNHKDQQTYLFACFLSQEEPKKVSQALADESWVKAMQEELLQFKLQEVWVLCDLPDGKRVIGTKWVFRNKRDERIEAIRLFLAFASFMGFTVYQMDVKSAFLYGNITEEVYVKQPPGFEDPSIQTRSTELSGYDWVSMYLTASRPEHNVCVVSRVQRFQVTPKKLFSDSDCWDNHDRTINFRRMSISWKKTGSLGTMPRNKTIVAISSTKAICEQLQVLCLGYFGGKIKMLLIMDLTSYEHELPYGQ
ncbi:putative ribonuclease H-like domain-containing protein [Tanacetum coccineum]